MRVVDRDLPAKLKNTCIFLEQLTNVQEPFLHF